MKFLLVSDTHLGLQKDSQMWLDVTLDLFNEILDYCSKNNISTIIHLGDFFHDRKSIGVKSINQALKIADQIEQSQVKMWLIPGNHDLYTDKSLDLSSLDLFEKYENIEVIWDTTVLNGKNILVPWKDSLRGLPKCDNIFGHFDIKSFPMNNSYIYQGGYEPEVFKGFKNVYSGHFHHRSVREMGDVTFHYLGSPFQQNFGDADSDRGYYIFDDKNNTLKFINFESAPKYIKLIADPKIEGDIENNIIKIIWHDDFGVVMNNKILEKVQAQNPRHLYTDFSNISIHDQKKEDTGDIRLASSEEILLEYIDTVKVPTYIHKSTLKQMVNNMIEELKREGLI